MVISSAFAMAFAAGLVGIGQSLSIKSALEGIARNPLAASKILSAMLIGLAMMESLAIYVLVIAFILLFANPFLGYF
ncbi:MAG: ATP synthase F0 subunit C [Thermodesulfobacteriota bacterium]